MSTLEKTINLLRDMPEQSIENVYRFIRVLQSRQDNAGHAVRQETSAFGIAHKYANPALIEKEKEAFQNAMLKKHANH